jgi:two-component system osmolarity sensor histidine kinase EnvZ
MLPPKYWGRWLKRQLPTSLFGRALLIIVLPVALMQLLVTWVFFEAHWETVTSRLSRGLAGDVAWVAATYEDQPTAAGLAQIAERAQALSLSVALQTGRPLPTERRPALLTLDRSLDTALDEALDRPFWFDTTRYPAYVDIRVQATGGVLRILAPRDRAFAGSAHIFVLWLGLATLLLTTVAVAFIRNQVRAIERLAAAADAFGRGSEPAFKPHGAAEVRQAGQAFIDMRTRINRHIEQRTALLASVSHDLRTPLTRLKLELALSPPGPRVEAMKGDLADMEHMIDEYLAFARTAQGAGAGGESVERVSLRAVIDEVSAGAERAGASVAVAAEPGLAAHVRPSAFKRALSNLVMNAAVHGEHVRVSARDRGDGDVEIVVDDDGPGIPRTVMRRRSAPSTASTRRETKTRRASASASPSPETSHAATAAMSPSSAPRSAACAPWSVFRLDGLRPLWPERAVTFRPCTAYSHPFRLNHSSETATDVAINPSAEG